ncbi:MAG TPA: glycoside hydrolase family 3 C-terminal domain-containing protein [Candidatus Onthomonas avicola]|nr:glycoside hydrolase family 3 C-terminal domain-containing protein [Candidatus Onthomonas avicola]
MLSINWSDVISLINENLPYFIALGAVLVVGILVMVLCLKLPKHTKYLIRTQTAVAMVLAIAVILNLFCTGPMYTLLSLASGEGSLSDETAAEVLTMGQSIAEEGIVLLENDESVLPYADANINVFGWASTNPVYGGTGSGSLNADYHIVSLLEGLQNAGFNTNTELSDFYTNYRADRPEVGMWAQDWTLPEPAADTYPDELMANAREFSDQAIIVIARSGGEHIELPKDVTGLNYTNNSEDYEDFPAGTHYLQLSQSERDMVDLVCSNFENVTLVYNGANTLEMNFLDQYPQIKGVVWCPSPGQNGFNALGEVLNGTVNPSGKAADTFLRDMSAAPWWNNFGSFTYDNMDEFRIADSDPYVPGTVPHFVYYVEGIYVGYKFYETAAVEGAIDYDAVVAYPFGQGLSYTTFSQEIASVTETDGQITVEVNVTNTGDVAGKSVVQVYYNPPYTNGGIEKSAANLIEFGKTGMLEPNASETVSVTFAVEDMASYDERGSGCYVLEAGDYVISINENSHVVYDSETYTVENTVVYDESNPRSTDETAAVNQFDFTAGAELTYLSRADGFANLAEATAAPASMSMPEEDKALFVNNSNFEPESDPDAVMPETGANNGMTIHELRGADYDDERWETLLDNLTIDEMVNMIALGGYQTAPAASIDKPATTDCDGPAALNNNFTQVGSIGFPCEVMIANSFNKELAYTFGDGIGMMAEEMNVSGWYAPAVNIHRTPFAGRNFEYYSEDGVLSGKLVTQTVIAAMDHGVYAYVKHFALNDQETHRWEMLTTWSNEQAIREIYLKPFEMAVKEGGTTAIMSSYNYIGTQWAGACSALLNTVLRDEWGYRGIVLTDYFADFGYMDATRSIYNGGSACLINRDVGTNYVTDTDNPTTVQQMRRACHDILYTAVNSRGLAPENLSSGPMTWQIILVVVDMVIVLVLAALELLVVRKGYAKRKTAAAS